ncbi:FAD-dependent monooxygenase [Spiractinospora alimapuensis]|uniref:FAD-dependent monooxygenase n=1 Tax=Spiractinospora alimapuensis TaxID=2820884 RepID=UPI001F2C62F6|nr:FAD-dependent monooxygenase [Spiractinospora alimapuensis]QVQ50252.1 FAD-dependent monooxygenase [Spiractinospora alimapuensis]
MKRVLISGASVAGPALAYWLARYGFDVTVVERAPTVRKGGYNIDVRGVGIDVVDRMGIRSDLQAARTGLRGLTMTSEVTPTPIDVPVGAFTAGEGDHNIEINRDALCARLFALTEGRVDYRFDDSIVALRDNGTGVAVDFHQGQGAEYDVVVGADGLHSTTRGLVFGPEERYAHALGAYVAFFSVAREELPHGWGEIATNRRRMAGVFANQWGETKAFLALRDGGNGTVARSDASEQRRFLAEVFVDFGGRVPRLLEQLSDASDFFFDSMSQIKMDTWSKGRVVLLGDAAYGPSPASGQGTSLALVGAYVLAGELARHNGDHQRAFPAYEERIRDFVTQNQRIPGTGLPFLVPATRRGTWVRDRFLRVAPHLRALSGLQRYLDPIHRAANAIDLPDYREMVLPSE